MATRIIYSLLVDGKKRLDCCPARRNHLDRLFPIVEMSKVFTTVDIAGLSNCGVCGMPCLYDLNHCNQ